MPDANSNFWIVKLTTPMFWILFGTFLILLVIMTLILRNRSETAKKVVICVICFSALIGFFFYKYFLSIDTEYDQITKMKGGFNWWGELPLHLCNINLILIPISVLTKKRGLMSFCFFVGSLGALMAIFMPGIGFDGYSILLPRMIGFFGTHYIIAIMALAIVTFGLYRPRFRDLPVTVLTILLVTLAVHGINMLFRVTGLYPDSNYFFTINPEGNPVLEMFYKWIPYPFLYQLPCIGILLVYVCFIMLGFTIFGKSSKRR
ncbi:MAG: YwaF family protein [Firmicutes bacterium]|nr:YwaF family protein [Bacillota bacterium]